MSSKKIIRIIVIVFFAAIFGWFFFNKKIQEYSYIQDHNKNIIPLQAARRSVQKNLEPLKEKIARDAMYGLVVKVTDSMSGDIEFYGRVVDQSGAPVAGAKVDYSASGYLYAKGSGASSVLTDSDGGFVISNAKGAALDIYKIIKDGYEVKIQDNFLSFKGMDEGHSNLVWSNYTKDKPYLFKAWMVSKYTKVNVGQDILGFEPDGRVYKIDLSSTPIEYGSKIDRGDITVSFSVDDSVWKVKIGAVDGGLQESDDYYMMLAPESGYFSEFLYEGSDKKTSDFTKNYYFMSRNGQYYGSIKMEVRPYMSAGPDIRISYVVNLEGGRELAVKPEE